MNMLQNEQGWRSGEAIQLQWRDIDLVRGTVSLDENKTDDPRDWALDPGTLEALRCWRAMRPDAGPSDLVFPAPSGAPYRKDALAEKLRRALKTAGVERVQLLEDGTNRKKVRAHDLRSTFVTLALAAGRGETWVADRTGHKSSAMIQRYERRARTARELGLGWLQPLHELVPELADCPAIAPAGGAFSPLVSEAPTEKASEFAGLEAARPVRFERTTYGFEVRCSIQLS